jgi:hypothetical protein
MEAEFLFEQVRHTGGARQVVSNDAVANSDTFHLPGHLLSTAALCDSSEKQAASLIGNHLCS